MNGLLQKDMPWIVAFSICGAVTLALVAAGNGFLHLFVVTPGRMEELFLTAASLGLFVGAFAGVWDDLLGTREFLQHRPVSAAKLARAPIAAVGLVLLAWLVLTPLLAWVFASFWSGVFLPTHWAGVPEILAAVGIAVPAAAVGLAAAALPSPWWLRILFGAGCAMGVGFAICYATYGDDGWSPPRYAAACLIAAIGMFALAAHSGTVRRDPDRAWPSRTRWLCGGTFVACVGLLGSAGAFEAQRGALRMLFHAYPRVAQHDGQFVLYRLTDDSAGGELVDRDHAPIGRVNASELSEQLVTFPGSYNPFRIGPPVWHPRGQSIYDWSNNRELELLLDHTGRAWVWRRREARLDRVASVGGQWSPARCQLQRCVDAGTGESVVLLGDRDSGRIWRFDHEALRLVEMALPDGDKFVNVRSVRRTAAADPAPILHELLEGSEREELDYVDGERGAYALRDKQWVAFEAPTRSPQRWSPRDILPRIGRDPIHFAVEVEASGERPAFRHEFTPRTASEHLHAAHACCWSLLRAPALQVVGFLRGHAPAGERQRTTIVDDPLLRGRSRPWLLALCVAIAALSVWTVRRRMRAFGADAATQRFWMLAAAATGVAGVLACGLCTRRRMFARPAVVPAPAPRIRSVPEPEEVLS